MDEWETGSRLQAGSATDLLCAFGQAHSLSGPQFPHMNNTG